MHERFCISFILGAALLSNVGALVAAQDATADAAAKASAANESSTTLQKEGEKAATGITSKSSASAAADESSEVKRGLATLKSGTTISTELDQRVDADTAKPGDIVSAKVTKDVKKEGRTIIRKGDHLLGRITSVDASTTGQAGSELAVTFDRLKRGDAEYPLNTVVSSVVSSAAEVGARSDMSVLDEPMIMPPAPARAGGGRAAGDLTGAVGGTATSAIGSAGSVVGASDHGSTRGGTQLGLSTPTRDIRLHSQTSASQSGKTTSMLGTRNGNLRLESGTQMKFKVSTHTNTETPKK